LSFVTTAKLTEFLEEGGVAAGRYKKPAIMTGRRQDERGEEGSSMRMALELSTSSMQTNDRAGPGPHPSGKSAALCLLAKAVEPYLDEYVDYYSAIGFSGIFIFDNSDNNTLQDWTPRSRSGSVDNNNTSKTMISVYPWPGVNNQRSAYQKCAMNLINYTNFTWAAFYDSDEFLVLRKHDNVVDLLQEHCDSGSLSINWVLMGTSNETFYRPLPMTKRFTYRHQEINPNVKTIVKLSDLDLSFNFQWSGGEQIHNFKLVNGTFQKDTNGTIFTGPYNANGPEDIAAIYHFLPSPKVNSGSRDVRRVNPMATKVIVSVLPPWHVFVLRNKAPDCPTVHVCAKHCL